MSLTLPHGLHTVARAKELEITSQDIPLGSHSHLYGWSFAAKGVPLGHSVVRNTGNSLLWDHRGRFVVEEYLRGDRDQTGLILAWLRGLLPDTWGVWFTDEFCYLAQVEPVLWTRQQNFSDRLAFPHVMFPDRRINWQQMSVIGHWMNDMFDPCCWDHVGCSIAFQTEAMAAMFLLRWQGEVIELPPKA